MKPAQPLQYKAPLHYVLRRNTMNLTYSLRPVLTILRGRRPVRRRKKKKKETKAEAGNVFHVEGIIGPGSDTVYAVNGEDIIIDDHTWCFGAIDRGSRVVVDGILLLDDRKYAKRITLSHHH